MVKSRTIDDYIWIDGKWQPKDYLDTSTKVNTQIAQINQPIERFDDYSQEGKGLKVLTVQEVMKQKGTGVNYLWGSFIPRKAVCLLSGEAGVGKTTFGYNLAINAAKGETFCDIPFDRPTSTFYCDLETDSIVRASKVELISNGNLPDRLYFLASVDFIKDYEDLKAEVLDRHVELVIVDTINEAFHTRDEQDNAEANRQFSYVKRLRDEANCSIILIHHIGKGQPGKKVYSARGASARGAVVDVVLNLISITEDTICLQKEKDRAMGGKEKLYIRKAGEDAFEVVEQGEEMEAPALFRAQKLVIELVTQGFMHRFELNEKGRENGTSDATIGRALEHLVRAGRLLRVKKGIYALPNPAPPSPF